MKPNEQSHFGQISKNQAKHCNDRTCKLLNINPYSVHGPKRSDILPPPPLPSLCQIKILLLVPRAAGFEIFISRCRYSNCDEYWSRLGLPAGHSKTFEDLYKSSEMSVVTEFDKIITDVNNHRFPLLFYSIRHYFL